MEYCETCKHWDEQGDGVGDCNSDERKMRAGLDRCHKSFGCILHQPKAGPICGGGCVWAILQESTPDQQDAIYECIASVRSLCYVGHMHTGCRHYWEGGTWPDP